MSLHSIPNIIPILSGKGGVGKSSVTVQLALTLALQGHDVGVLDIDLTGPSIPRLFGIEASKIRQAPGGWIPVEVNPGCERLSSAQSPEGRLGSIHCMSLGFLLHDRGDAVIWRGPKKTAMVKQLLSDVLWPQGTEYLLIDTPPGTSDEHISLITNLLDPAKVLPFQKLGAVIVTTPQAIATADVRKELSFCATTKLKVLGLIENMAGYVCPCCGEITNVFSKGGGEIMAQEWTVRFLGSVPIDGEGWGMLVEEGRRPVYQSTRQSPDVATSDDSARNKDNSLIPGSVDRFTGTLAENYTACALYSVFDAIATNLLGCEASIPKHPAP